MRVSKQITFNTTNKTRSTLTLVCMPEIPPTQKKNRAEYCGVLILKLQNSSFYPVGRGKGELILTASECTGWTANIAEAARLVAGLRRSLELAVSYSSRQTSQCSTKLVTWKALGLRPNIKTVNLQEGS